ncbi:MAG: DUF1441 family protein [Sodalis sp. (in: enterobacteria)]|uniref:DUF1441 family protein n=1 Tax=Sodalis sp. (in: enterobacteria) TaxID=1898979 RepID=UPI0039E5277A
MTELSAAIGRDRKTVAAMVRSLPLAEGSSKTRKYYRVQDLLMSLSAPQEIDVSAMTPAERRAHWQAENERLKYQQEMGQLLPAHEVKREFSSIAKAVVQVLETLTDILDRDCALSPTVIEQVQETINDLRDNITMRVREDDTSISEEPSEE